MPLIPLTFGFTFAIIVGVPAQGPVYNPNPSSPALNNGLPMPSRNDSATGPNSTGNTGKDDEDDPSLQRLKSSDSLGQGQMARDEGQLTAKVRRREKILHVESTKQLPTSGSDPKFQGSLLHSSVSSITDIGEKANITASPAESETNAVTNEEADPRFKAKRPVFKSESDESKTQNQSPRIKADSSPSPSPSPSASVTPSSR